MSFRKFVSLVLFLSFAFLLLSGIVLFIMPHGRVAYWTDWRFINLNKDQWSNLHIFFSLIFIFSGIFHIFFNFKPLINYCKKAKIELLLTVIISIFVFIGSVINFPPFSFVTNFEEKVKNSWIDNKIAPKIPHGELWSLKKLIKKLNISKKEALKRLKDKGIKVESIEQSIKEIAEKNNKKLIEIFMILKGKK